MSMKIRFGAIYSEVNTSFPLHHLLLKELAGKLNALDKNIDFFNEKFSGKDYSLNIILSATRNNNVLEVKGPRVLKKDSRVEFVPIIPYVDGEDFKGRVIYALKNIEVGILTILERYGTDMSGVSEVFVEVVDLFSANPEQFQYAP